MNIKANWVIDWSMNIDQLKTNPSFYFLSFIRTVKKTAVVKNKIVFFPGRKIATPEI
jgi:hypothetical protein